METPLLCKEKYFFFDKSIKSTFVQLLNINLCPCNFSHFLFWPLTLHKICDSCGSLITQDFLCLYIHLQLEHRHISSAKGIVQADACREMADRRRAKDERSNFVPQRTKVKYLTCGLLTSKKRSIQEFSFDILLFNCPLFGLLSPYFLFIFSFLLLC